MFFVQVFFFHVFYCGYTYISASGNINPELICLRELLEFKNRIRSDCLSALAHVLKIAEFENAIGSSMDLKHDVKEFQCHTERGKYAVEPGWSSDPKLHELALQLWNEPIVQEIIACNGQGANGYPVP